MQVVYKYLKKQCWDSVICIELVTLIGRHRDAHVNKIGSYGDTILLDYFLDPAQKSYCNRWDNGQPRHTNDGNGGMMTSHYKYIINKGQHTSDIHLIMLCALTHALVIDGALAKASS